MRTTAVFLLWSLLLLTISAQEVRIPAYVNRGQNKPVIRIIPANSAVIRVRKPGQSKPEAVSLRDSSVTRIQPVLVLPNVSPRVSLERILSEMGLRRMASLIHMANLQTYLQTAGPVTLFAPTDEAFSLSSPPKDLNRLRDFILQHVVRGRIAIEDVRNDVTIPSLRSGSHPLRFNVYDDGQILSVSGSQFLDDARDAGDIRIQPVDSVLYPISNDDLTTEVKLSFPRMHQYLLKASLTEQLNSGTFTLFAPTDDAFDSLTPELRGKLMQNSTLLRKVLLNHVVPGTHYSAVLAHGFALRSLGGEPIYFTNRRGLILANGAPLVKSDISVTNGVIHALNRLLLPPELHPRRRPATLAPPRRTTPAPRPPDDDYLPVPTYMEPPPPVPRSLTKTMSTPLQLPDGRQATFSTGNSLFRRSLLLNTLRNNGSDMVYTILMPTDAAFGEIGQEKLDKIRRNSRLLRRMLLCQMVQGRLNLTEDTKDRPIRSLGGTIIISSLDDGKSLMAGGARVLSVREAADGLVLVTDRVIIPSPNRNVVEGLKPFPTLKRILEQQPDIPQRLSSENAAFTVFAPSDAALASIPPEQLRDPNFVSELFWSHVVRGTYYRRRLSPGLHLTTLRGKTIIVTRPQSGSIFVNGRPLGGKEILAGNGVIHPVDNLLFDFPPPSPPTVTATQPGSMDRNLNAMAQEFNATDFLNWMLKAGMQDILQKQVSKTGSCTLFLPTNRALKNMSPTLRSATLGDAERLRKFIRFHISPRPLRWESVHDNSLLPSLLPGKNIRCNIYASSRSPGVLTVSGCRVTAMRPLSRDSNVTVAVIDEPMAPPLGSLELVASKSPFLSNFSKILKLAKLDEMLSDGGPYTLFVSNSCVFAKMDPDQYRRLISNRKLAREFVKRYVVRGCLYSNGLQDGQVLETLAETTLKVQVNPDCILISGVKLLYGDMSATNGVLHVVAELLPP
ncbi:periostin-like [Stegodyphus dumicola]|uniref:periostin-like n=1 Tax=Stegodyphus dumicola TaxID=202533 RepID=UPI0015AFB7F6|nr:periostin-like [Stegodyphus dumicola]